MESFRNQDMRAEARLGEFMDAYFYSKLQDTHGNKISFKRSLDRSVQLQGMDVRIDIDDRTYIIDEKAAIYYSNMMIDTFAFELDSIQKGHEFPVEGWFLNDELKTKYYMVIWPNVKCRQDANKKIWVRKSIEYLTKDDFTIVEAMMIEKVALRKKLENEGYNSNRLKVLARDLRNECQGLKKPREQVISPFYKLYYSGQLAEAPINLVIKKDYLKSVALGTYYISADGFARIVR